MAFGGENAESYYDEGLTALVRGEVEGAVKAFQRATQLDNGFIAAHHQLGKCYARLGQIEEAIELLEWVVRQKPGVIQSRLDLGNALLQGGFAERAREQFTTVLHQDPQNGRAHLGMAQVHFQNQDWPRSVAAAQAARAYAGPNFATLFLLGRAAKQAGNLVLATNSLKEADAIIKQSSEFDPESPEFHYLRGQICFAEDDLAKAIDHYRAAEDRIQRDRFYAVFGQTFTYLDILAQRGICLQRVGNLTAAKEIGEKIVAACPEHAIGRSLCNL